MSRENLINDFILEKTNESPSPEKISKLVDNYKDNDEALINDLYVHYTGDSPDPEKIVQIKENYAIGTPEAPVKKDETPEVISQEEVTVSDSNGEETITSSESLEVQEPKDKIPPRQKRRSNLR